MTHHPAMLWMGALAAALALLIGYFALQSGAEEAAVHHPHDKANHHAKQVE